MIMAIGDYRRLGRPLARQGHHSKNVREHPAGVMLSYQHRLTISMRNLATEPFEDKRQRPLLYDIRIAIDPNPFQTHRLASRYKPHREPPLCAVHSIFSPA